MLLSQPFFDQLFLHSSTKSILSFDWSSARASFLNPLVSCCGLFGCGVRARSRIQVEGITDVLLQSAADSMDGAVLFLLTDYALLNCGQFIRIALLFCIRAVGSRNLEADPGTASQSVWLQGLQVESECAAKSPNGCCEPPAAQARARRERGDLLKTNVICHHWRLRNMHTRKPNMIRLHNHKLTAVRVVPEQPGVPQIRCCSSFAGCQIEPAVVR